MTLRVYLPLAILALGIGCLVASLKKPGYMDADYYYAGGAQLAYGFGFSERVLWNYLDDPGGLPHPSHGYWMPGASILAALGMALFGKIEFSSARFGLLLLFACLPLLTANLAYSFSHQRKAAWLAGLLAIFSSFYLPYLTTIDTFTLYACQGALFLLVIGKLTPTILPQKTPSGSTWLSPSSLPLAVIIFVPFFSGVLAGMMHLTRADGIIWFGVALLVSTLGLPRHNKNLEELIDLRRMRNMDLENDSKLFH